MDSPLPKEFDLAEHYGDAGDDEGYDSQKDEDDGSDGYSTYDWPQRPARKPAPESTNSSHENSSMLKDLIEFLIPPRDDRPESIRRWRISIGIAMVILYGHVLLACGWLQTLGFSGFAYASDVKSIKIELLEQRIFDARLRQCSATSQESRQFYASKVQELLSKFRETEGQYRLPSCDEVR